MAVPASMKDIQLWYALKGTDEDIISNLDQLYALAELPFKERLPFLARLLPLTRHENTQIRKAAFCALGGAAGYTGLQVLLSGCSDNDPDIRKQALLSFHQSCYRDPNQWVLALFHPDADIRQMALDKNLPDDYSEVLSLALVLLTADHDLNTLVESKIKDHKIAWKNIPVLLRLYNDGHISAETAGALIVGMKWDTDLNSFFKNLGLTSIVTADPVSSSNGEPDPLVTLLRIFWKNHDDGADGNMDEVTGLVKLFWNKLFRFSFTSSAEQLKIFFSNALHTAAGLEKKWIQPAVDVLVMIDIHTLTDEEIPFDLRCSSGKAITEHFVNAEMYDIKTIDKLLNHKICLDDHGKPNLPVITGILLRLKPEKGKKNKTPDPYRVLVNKFGIDPVVDAIVDRPEESASLFTLSHDRNSEVKTQILLRLKDKSVEIGAILYCAIIAGTPTSRLDFLEDTDTNILIDICQALLKYEGETKFIFSKRKLEKAAEIIANKLEAEQYIPIVKIWHSSHREEQSYFGEVLLTNFSIKLETNDFLEKVRLADYEDLLKLLTLIDFCPAFPLGKERALAEEFRTHPNADVVKWCADRISQVDNIDIDIKDDTEFESQDILAEHEAEIIFSADIHELEDILVHSLTQQRKGICDALLERPADGEQSVVACAAALKSLDPLDQIDAVFYRYGNDTPSFLNELDRLMIKNMRLPQSLFGNCFLYLWEDHCFTAAEQIERLPGAFIKFIEIGNNIQSSPISDAMWLALKRLVGMWRYRDRSKLISIFTPELAEKIVDQLTNDNESASIILMKIFEFNLCEDIFSNLEERVRQEIHYYTPEIRRVLAPWIDCSGVTGKHLRLTVEKKPLEKEIVEKINSSRDTEYLINCCMHSNGNVVNEAVLRIIELVEPLQELAQLMVSDPVPNSIDILTDAIPLWPENDALAFLEDAIKHTSTPLVSRYKITLGLIERGYTHYDNLIFEILNTETDTFWFSRKDWQRLVDLGIDECTLAETCVVSPHPVLYEKAVDIILSAEFSSNRRIQLLRSFLYIGRHRSHWCRSKVSLALAKLKCPDGLPIILKSVLEENVSVEYLEIIFTENPELFVDTLESIMIGGTEHIEDVKKILKILDIPLPCDKSPIIRGIIKHNRNSTMRQEATNRIIKDTRHNRIARQLAGICKEGMQIAFNQTDRLFQIKMLETGEIGYTRLDEAVIYATPIPVITGVPEGGRIVRGVILHEIGHHIYHADETSRDVSKEAHQEGLAELLNVVQDEHLERNMRAKNKIWGDDFKKLAAYAFQHSDREANAYTLLRALDVDAFFVLSNASVTVGVKKGCLAFNSGIIWQKLEQGKNSFSRFMRALRMGLGNRHNDTKVEAGLKLFSRGFRNSSPERLLQIARDLKKIFGIQTAIIRDIIWDGITVDPETLLIGSEGITQEDIDKALEEISDIEITGKSGMTFNKSDDEHFEKITRIIHIPFDRASHQEYAGRTMIHSRQMRSFFERIGVRYVQQRMRVSGRRLDRSRLQKLAMYGEPRLMIARTLKPVTDLFLSIIIDCSSSMGFDNNIEKAKQFGTMLAESTVGVDGVDVRIFGFTDDVIYDAGTAARCSVSGMYAGGGNNDAAALWHAAQIAVTSRRAVKLLVMISDGAPTECSTTALRLLVRRLNRQQICCAQIALRELDPEDVCFPWYIELTEDDLTASVRLFGGIMIKLIKQAIGG